MTLPLPGWHMGMDRICDKARGTCPIQAGPHISSHSRAIIYQALS